MILLQGCRGAEGPIPTNLPVVGTICNVDSGSTVPATVTAPAVNITDNAAHRLGSSANRTGVFGIRDPARITLIRAQIADDTTDVRRGRGLYVALVLNVITGSAVNLCAFAETENASHSIRAGDVTFV